jgi:hypothetical protein
MKKITLMLALVCGLLFTARAQSVTTGNVSWVKEYQDVATRWKMDFSKVYFFLSEDVSLVKNDEFYRLEAIDKPLKGEGIILLQSPIENKKIESFKVIKVKAGDKIHIPKNTGHLALNTGKTWLVTSDDSPVNFEEKDPVGMPGHADYESVRKMKGFAYYVVEKNGKPDFVKNNEYIDIPEIEFVL